MKPVKTEGNFVVYEGEARRAAFATVSDTLRVNGERDRLRMPRRMTIQLF
jgi:hypothetical protein